MEKENIKKINKDKLNKVNGGIPIRKREPESPLEPNIPGCKLYYYDKNDKDKKEEIPINKYKTY